MLLSDLIIKSGGDADFARPLGAKDKKPRKKRKAVADVLKSGVTGATTTAGLTWTAGESLKGLKSKKLKKASKKLLKNVPTAARVGLGAGLTLPLIKKLLKKRKD